MTTAVARRDERAPRQQTNAVALADPASVQQALRRDDRRAGLVALLGDAVSIERFEQVVLQAVVRNPDLQRASLTSLLDSVRIAATLRLEPTGILGEGYLIRYGNDAQFEAGYRGLMKLARRSGQVAALDSQVVYAADQFGISLGTEPRIDHIPALRDRGGYVGAYAWARLTTGELVTEWMSVADIEAVRKVSRNGTGSSSPWVNHWGEMARKTVIKRLMKRLPLGLDAETAIQHEAEMDAATPAPARQSPAVADIHARLGMTTHPAAGPMESPAPGSADTTPERAPDPAAAESATEAGAPGPVADDAVIEGDAVEVALCGDPSPYGDGTTCTRDADHPEQVMCTDGRATWKRGAAQ